MKIKYMMLTIAFVLTIALSTAGSAIACSGGKTAPPPDTASVQLQSPTR
jgi:hypothetical protein